MRVAQRWRIFFYCVRSDAIWPRAPLHNDVMYRYAGFNSPVVRAHTVKNEKCSELPFCVRNPCDSAFACDRATVYLCPPSYMSICMLCTAIYTLPFRFAMFTNFTCFLVNLISYGINYTIFYFEFFNFVYVHLLWRNIQNCNMSSR